MKRSKRPARLLAYSILLFSFTITLGTHSAPPSTTPPADTGKALFEHYCSRCHGADGTKGFLGAKNLKKSRLADSAIIKQIQNGKRIMPSFQKKIKPEEIQALAIYIKTLRTN